MLPGLLMSLKTRLCTSILSLKVPSSDVSPMVGISIISTMFYVDADATPASSLMTRRPPPPLLAMCSPHADLSRQDETHLAPARVYHCFIHLRDVGHCEWDQNC